MQVTYTLEPADLTQFEKFGAMRRRQGFNVARFIRIVVVIFILMAIIYSLQISSHQGPSTAGANFSGLMISIVIPLAVIVGVWTFLLRNVRKLPAPSLFSRRQILEIRPEHIQAQSEGIETTVQWSRICEIVSDERSLYFFTDEVTAYIVPRRTFPTPNLAETFLATAVAYWKGKAAPSSSTDVWPPALHAGTVLKREKNDDQQSLE